jgi:hypothetical protein
MFVDNNCFRLGLYTKRELSFARAMAQQLEVQIV